MAFFRPRPPKESPLGRVPFRLYAAMASLELAVVVIAASALVLAWATLWVERLYGSEAARFGVYGTWWFAALLALLALNVLAAALIRFPWQRKQTGFVVTHVGILVLLAGCLWSRAGGIDAQLPLYENGTGSVAYEDTEHFRMSVAGQSPTPTTIDIPFASGPFNWSNYGNQLFWFPWQLAHRDRGVIYDQDGVRLEVVDYYANSRRTAAPPLVLRVKDVSDSDASGATAGSSDSAEATAGQASLATHGERVAFSILQKQSPHNAPGQEGGASRQTLSGGQRITFAVAQNAAETEAFLQSSPQGPLGELGQVVLYVREHVFRLPVDDLQAKKSVPLGASGLTVALDRIVPEFRGVALRVEGGGVEVERMILLADVPELNQQAARHGVFGAYWLNVSTPPDETSETADPHAFAAAGHEPRIDILQGADRQLCYRVWNAPDFGGAGLLPLEGPTSVPLPGRNASLELTVEDFVAHDLPGVVIAPLPFRKPQQGMRPPEPRVLLRLTVDGSSEEFWLAPIDTDPLGRPLDREQRRMVHGRRRTASVELRKDEIDVGVSLFLHKFQRKLDPGTSMASHYSSLVDLRDTSRSEKVLDREVLITLNQPINVTDPVSGRTYRLYQESFGGPWQPGDARFDEFSSPDESREERFLSWLTVNYDPGRGLKYFGSLLIVAGVTTMFYMKAYFFKPRRKHRE